MMTLFLHQLMILFSLLLLAVSVTHVGSHSVKDDRSDGSITVAQINVQVSLEGNTTSNGLMSRKRFGVKGEKGERGKAGPPGRPAAENECSCNCCSRLGEIEEKLANLTLLLEHLQRNETVQSSQRRGYRSCQEANQLGQTRAVSGVYTVDPGDGLEAFEVYCDMLTDGGGWTVFQRRRDESVNFYRDWSDYQNGFGDLNGEFWLGLDKIHRLTKKQQLLRIDLMSFEGTQLYAQYKGFQISDENSKYTMTFTSYSGNASDSLNYHIGMKFTTRDNDNDKYSDNCAVEFTGAWWYKSCYWSNLNGRYFHTNSLNEKGICWGSWRDATPLQHTEMKLR